MSWRTVKLGEFLKVREDRFKPKDEVIQGLKRVDKIDFSGNIYLSNKNSNTDMILVKQGDLLISGINVEKGAIAVYDGQEDITATIHYSSYEFDDGKVDIEFLKLFLKSSEFLQAIKEQVPGGIKTEIKPKHLLPLKVTIPELEEQKKVVEQFSSIHSKQNLVSTELNHQLALVKELRQAYLREAMQGKLVVQDDADEPAEILLDKIKAEKEKLVAEKRIKRDKPLPSIMPEEIPFEIPSNWTWCRLGELVSILGDGLHGTPEYSNNGECYFVNGNNLVNGKIEFKETTKKVSFDEYGKYKKEMNANTILVSINGTLGNIAFYNYEKIILGKSACYFNLLEGINKYFIGFLIKSQYFLKYAVDVASETTIKNVSLKSMRNLPIPLPPLAEQERIVAKLEKLLKACDELEANIRRGISNADSLVQVALKEALESKTDC